MGSRVLAYPVFPRRETVDHARLFAEPCTYMRGETPHHNAVRGIAAAPTVVGAEESAITTYRTIRVRI